MIHFTHTIDRDGLHVVCAVLRNEHFPIAIVAVDQSRRLKDAIAYSLESLAKQIKEMPIEA